MAHQTFWKPEKVVKEKKQWKPGQKPRKEIQEWKKDILSHHASKPSKADRAEFPRSVVKDAIERSRGICQCCKQAACTTTHHVFGRGRGGRGVLSNAYRACGNCHINIESNDELKNVIIEEYRILYGDRFWYDEQDWEEYNRKQALSLDAERDKQAREEQLEPIVNLLAVAAGRALKAKEMRLIGGMNDKEITVFAKLMQDVIGSGLENGNKPEFGYGKFDD